MTPRRGPHQGLDGVVPSLWTNLRITVHSIVRAPDRWRLWPVLHRGSSPAGPCAPASGPGGSGRKNVRGVGQAPSVPDAARRLADGALRAGYVGVPRARRPRRAEVEGGARCREVGVECRGGRSGASALVVHSASTASSTGTSPLSTGEERRSDVHTPSTGCATPPHHNMVGCFGRSTPRCSVEDPRPRRLSNEPHRCNYVRGAPGGRASETKGDGR